jgi:hypothetical protein
MATMIARLSKEPGERELLLLYQFHRTMFEIVKTFRWQGRLLSALTRWVESPKNRLKDSTKNLLVFISYLLCLPLESLSKHLPSEDSWTKLWLTLLEETVRRGADNITKNFDDNRINQILDAFVLYEAQTVTSLFQNHLFKVSNFLEMKFSFLHSIEFEFLFKNYSFF